MHSSNPAFARRPEFSQAPAARGAGAYPGAAAQQGWTQANPHWGRAQHAEPQTVGWNEPPQTDQRYVMTLDDVLTKSGLLFGILAATAAATWFVLGSSPLLFAATFGSMLLGLGVAIWIGFSKQVRVPLIVAYAAIEGVFVGGISRLFEYRWDGIVGTAVLATMATFVGMLMLYRMRIIRVTPKFTKILIMATAGYLIFALANLVAVWVFNTGSVYQMGLLGLGISVLGVGLASLNLALDFDFIERGVANQLPAQYSWLAAHGLIVTLVWLYIEILRLIAILRGDS
jgi:uncharacterized YccA/Bax inhibitor family protein